MRKKNLVAVWIQVFYIQHTTHILILFSVLLWLYHSLIVNIQYSSFHSFYPPLSLSLANEYRQSFLIWWNLRRKKNYYQVHKIYRLKIKLDKMVNSWSSMWKMQIMRAWKRMCRFFYRTLSHTHTHTTPAHPQTEAKALRIRFEIPHLRTLKKYWAIDIV